MTRRTWRHSVGRWAGRSLIVLFILSAGFLVYSNIVYYSPPPADLPCRNCSGEARAVHLGGFDLYYREIGSDSGRAPVVVLHGGPGHSSMSFKNGFDFLASNRRVIFYDQRGSGNSQIRPDSSLYTVDQLVEELEVLRRDVIRAEKIVLVGHSAGGALAQRYALAHQDRVERMILVSSVPINNGVGIPILWDVLFPPLFVLGAGQPPADPQEANRWYGHLMLSSSYPRLFDPSHRELVEDSGYISFATWREVSRSLEGNDFHDNLGRLTVRTLVLYGAADSGTTGEACAEAICDAIPDCLLVGFPQSGHWAFLEEPSRFSEVVTEFLNGG